MINSNVVSLVLLALLCCYVGCNRNEQVGLPPRASAPDTSLSVKMARWPDESDLQKLEHLKGKGPVEVIESIGHPARLEIRNDGVAIWHYDWPAACYVTMKSDVVEDCFYTAGF